MASPNDQLLNVPAEVHTGDRCARTWAMSCGQTSPAGNLLERDRRVRTVCIGDPVVVDDGSRDVQLASPHGGFIVVRDGIFTEWADTIAADLPCLNALAEPATVSQLEVAAGIQDPAARQESAPHRMRRTMTEIEHLLTVSRERRKKAEAGALPYNCAICQRIVAERVRAAQGGTRDVPLDLVIN